MLAEKLRVSEDTIGNYERDKREPDDEMKLKIARIFNVSVDYLLGLINYEISYNRDEYIPMPRNAPKEFKEEAQYLVDLLKYKYELK